MEGENEQKLLKTDIDKGDYGIVHLHSGRWKNAVAEGLWILLIAMSGNLKKGFSDFFIVKGRIRYAYDVFFEGRQGY